MCFDISSDESQTIFDLVCDSVYVGWPIEVTTDSDPEIIGPDKARKGVIYPLKMGIYALVEISERTFTRLNF